MEAWAGQLAEELGLARADARALLARARQQWRSQQAGRQQAQQVLLAPAAAAPVRTELVAGPHASDSSAATGAATEGQQEQQQVTCQVDAKAPLQELADQFAAQVQPALLADLCRKLEEAGPATCYAAAREWLLAAMQVAKHELWRVLRSDAGRGAGAKEGGGVRLLLVPAGTQLGAEAVQRVRQAAAVVGTAA